jgi:hypothetical protein
MEEFQKFINRMVMHPSELDYTLLDPIMRNLIAKINIKPWIKTFGCCGGPAQHNSTRRIEKPNFYIIVEVKGQDGVYKLARWLGRAHELGYKLTYKDKTLPDFALYDAVLCAPNLLHKEIYAGASLGKDWFRFYIQLKYMREPNRKETLGSIFCLEHTL